MRTTQPRLCGGRWRQRAQQHDEGRRHASEQRLLLFDAGTAPATWLGPIGGGVLDDRDHPRRHESTDPDGLTSASELGDLDDPTGRADLDAPAEPRGRYLERPGAARPGVDDDLHAVSDHPPTVRERHDPARAVGWFAGTIAAVHDQRAGGAASPSAVRPQATPAPEAVDFSDVLVAVPTYNEAQNAPRLVRELREHLPGAAILVIDDASPDGTGDLVVAACGADPLVRVHRRPSKLGLGTAYLVAFGAARRQRARIVMTMDSDFSHRPRDAAAIIDAARRGDVDLAIGSRYVPGGRVVGWSRGRTVLSSVANSLIKTALDVRVTDCTGSFRAYSMDLVERLDLTALHSTGYSALPELLLLVVAAGGRIREVPVTFVEREHGATKLTQRELLDSLLNLAWLRSRRRELAKRRAA